MARVPVAALLILYGLAHALLGSHIVDAAVGWVTGMSPGHPFAVALATLLWAAATVGLISGGLGLLGAEPFRRWWGRIAWVGAAASLLLLMSFQPNDLVPGGVLDVVILVGLSWWIVLREPSTPQPRRRWMRTLWSGQGSANY